MSDYTSKIQRGVDLLDDHFGGSSWKKDINLDNLDLGSCGVCVLGQLFGDYSDGLEVLDISRGHDYGFDSPSTGSFSELTEAWKDALGENKVLVEQGDVYRDTYGYAAKVLQTHILTVDGVTVTTYVVETGKIVYGAFKSITTNPDLTLLKKSNFEKGGNYPIKVEKFVVKKGMFLTNSVGGVFYAVSENEVRPVKNGARTMYLSSINQDGLKELITYTGAKFSETLVK